jgi:hypothetical protein
LDLPVRLPFAILRNLAWPLKQTIEGILVKTKVAGQSVAGFSMILNQSKLLANTISFLLLSIKHLSGLSGLVILELFGVILNTISAMYLRKIPIETIIQKKSIIMKDNLQHLLIARGTDGLSRVAKGCLSNLVFF